MAVQPELIIGEIGFIEPCRNIWGLEFWHNEEENACRRAVKKRLAEEAAAARKGQHDSRQIKFTLVFTLFEVLLDPDLPAKFPQEILTKTYSQFVRKKGRTVPLHPPDPISEV